MKFIEKLKKSEQGSVTIYVLSVTICVILILLSIFVGVMNKSSSQYKQIEQICSEYSGKANNEKIDNVYKETINRLNLTERKLLSKITGNETANTPAKDNLGNPITIPAGFEVVNPNDNVEDGIVVRDKTHTKTAGSEFVWIPVGDVKTTNKGTINIDLNRYTFDSNGKETKQGTNKIDNGYTEDTAANHNSSYGNTIAKDIEDFKSKAASSHGYYIGRYEARTATERYNSTTDDELKQITTKPNDYVYNWVTQPQAATLSRGMYEGTPFESDLMNSYAWDTATLFLQTFDNRTNKDSLKKYSRQTSLNTSEDGLATQGTNKLDTSKKDKICNVYDMASNYREWSTETCSYGFGPCTRRGGFYDDNSTFTSTRLDGRTTNSFGGTSFRPILYLENSTLDSNGLDTITGNETENTTVQDSLGNQVVVPAGFEVVNPNDNVEDGIVVRDKTHTNTAGSEFVWIPVGDVKTRDKGTINIELKRYVFNEDGTVNEELTKTEPGDQVQPTGDPGYYTEGLENSQTDNTPAKNIAIFRKKAEGSHGYYIGRYEARTATERSGSTTDDNLTQITTKPNEYVYNWVTQPQAAALSRGMYEGTPFESDLINSYAWDTATLFLQTIDNRTTDKTKKYSRQNSLNTGSPANTGTNNLAEAIKQDKICNVYDMASNCFEWSTETYSGSSYPCTGRGGFYGSRNNYTSGRYYSITTNSGNYSSFRPLLYL